MQIKFAKANLGIRPWILPPSSFVDKNLEVSKRWRADHVKMEARLKLLSNIWIWYGIVLFKTLLKKVGKKKSLKFGFLEVLAPRGITQERRKGNYTSKINVFHVFLWAQSSLFDITFYSILEATPMYFPAQTRYISQDSHLQNVDDVFTLLRNFHTYNPMEEKGPISQQHMDQINRILTKCKRDREQLKEVN